MWTEIRRDYTEEISEGKLTVSIDAWKSNDDNEQGEVIALVEKELDGRIQVIYKNNLAVQNDYAQEVIKEVINDLKDAEVLSSIDEKELTIETITLLDGITPDPDVQYKLGRTVFNLLGELGKPILIAYNETKGWYTYPSVEISKNEDKVIIKDHKSIYTFKKI